jgi:O-antigen ligase
VGALPFFFILPVRRSRKLILLGSAVAVAVLAYVAVPVDVKLRAESIMRNVSGQSVGISAAGRFEMWKVGFRDFLESPVFGKGSWSYGLRDNFYVKVLGEAGILGFATFIVLIYIILKEEFKAILKAVKDDFVRGLCLGLLPATIACLSLFNLTGDYVLVHRFMGIFWIVLALVLKYSWNVRHTGLRNGR